MCPTRRVSSFAFAASTIASCAHAWPPRGQSLFAAAALFAIALNMSPAGAPNSVWAAHRAASTFDHCMVNTCLLYQPVCFSGGLAKATPLLVQRVGHCLTLSYALPGCHLPELSWQLAFSDRRPSPFVSRPHCGHSIGSPACCSGMAGGSTPDQAPSPRSSTVVHTCPLGGGVSSSVVVTHSAQLPLQPRGTLLQHSGTLLQHTQCMSSSSPAVVAQPQAVTSLVVAGQDKLQAASKEPPTLLLPITGLLGIPGILVLKIRSGKYVDLEDLLPEALEWAWRKEGRGEEKEVCCRYRGRLVLGICYIHGGGGAL